MRSDPGRVTPEERAAIEALWASEEYREWEASDRWEFWMEGTVRVFVERAQGGDPHVYFTPERPKTQTLVNTAILAFSRRQRDAGVPLWWPHAEEHLDDAPVVQTGGWQWKGPGDPDPRMLAER